MRARDTLTRLAAVAPPAEPLLAAGEEERILERIVASPRRTPTQRRPLLLAATGVAVLAAAGVAASLELGRTKPSSLTGVTFKVAGYRFRTPAGYKRSTACISAPVPGRPRPAIDGFAAAASSNGGCIEAVAEVPSRFAHVPSDAVAVPVGSYDGYYVAGDTAQAGILYVRLPDAGGPTGVQYVELSASDMSEGQLIAVAESGLATLPPPGPMTTTGTETTG